MVGLFHDLNPFGSDLADDSDADARSGEGVPHDKILMDAELAAETPHLVLEPSGHVSPRVRNMRHQHRLNRILRKWETLGW